MYWNFVVVGYVAVYGGVVAYALWLSARGRRLSSQVPEERRRFLD